MLLIGIGLALAVFPGGWLATQIGNQKVLLGGLLTLIVALAILAVSPNYILLMIAVLLIIINFSIVVNSAIPFVFEIIPANHAGLGIGIYFGGFGGAMSLFDLIFPKLGQTTPLINATIGAITFFLAAICVKVRKQ